MMKLHEQGGEGDCVTASTLHSCAMRLVKGGKGAMSNDHALEGIIAKEFSRDMENYILPAMRHIISINYNDRILLKKLKRIERTMREPVVSYLSKAFTNFCRSKMTLEQLSDESYHARHWFPST